MNYDLTIKFESAHLEQNYIKFGYLLDSGIRSNFEFQTSVLFENKQTKKEQAQGVEYFFEINRFFLK